MVLSTNLVQKSSFRISFQSYFGLKTHLGFLWNAQRFINTVAKAWCLWHVQAARVLTRSTEVPVGHNCPGSSPSPSPLIKMGWDKGQVLEGTRSTREECEEKPSLSHCLRPMEGRRWFCAGTIDTACSRWGQSCSPSHCWPARASPGAYAGLAGPGTVALAGSAGFCAPCPHSLALDSSSSPSENSSFLAFGSLMETGSPSVYVNVFIIRKACWYQQPLKVRIFILSRECVCICACVHSSVKWKINDKLGNVSFVSLYHTTVLILLKEREAGQMRMWQCSDQFTQ